MENTEAKKESYLINRVVDGDRVVSETYKFNKAIVEVIGPPPMTEEDIHRVLEDIQKAGWSIIEDLITGEEDI